MVQAVVAGRSWVARLRDLPDVAGYADFVAHPDLAFERIQRRIAENRFPFDSVVFPIPKSNGGLRKLVWLDPYDDIVLRVILGRIAPVLQRLLHSSDVYSYPLRETGSNWRCAPPREAVAARKARGLDLLEDKSCAGVGTFDVEDYYANVDLAKLARQLTDAGCPLGAVHALLGGLQVLHDLDGVSGLPIGFEGSGPLGNVYLLNADSTAADRRLGLVRYTDDTWLFLRDEKDFDESYREYAAFLEPLGLRPNLSKTRFHGKEGGDAWEVVSNALLDSVTEGNSRRVSVDEAKQLIVQVLDAGEVDGPVLRFAFGALRHARDLSGLSLVKDYPVVFQREPKAVGDYLVAIANDPLLRNSVDREWIVELATTNGSASTLAARLQACRAAAHLHLSKSAGQALLELVGDKEHVAQVPLRAWAAMAWARSEHWRPGTAADVAMHEGCLGVRRSLVLSFKGRGDSKRAIRALDRLARLEPDLGPTLAWATE